MEVFHYEIFCRRNNLIASLCVLLKFFLLLYNALFTLRAFRFLLTVLSKNKNNNSKKKTFFCLSPIPFFFHSVPPFPYLFHPSHLPSVFIQYFSPFLSLPLSHFSTSIPHVLNRLSLLVAHSAPSLLSFRPVPVFSLVPTSKSPHHFSFSCTLSQVVRNFLCHIPLILPVVSGFFDSFHSFLLVYVFVPFTQLYIHPFLLLSIFPLLHWHTRSSGSTFLSPSSPCSCSFLFSIPSVSCTFSFHLFCPQTLPLSFPLSLSPYSSYTLPSLCKLTLLCSLLAPISNIFLALSLPPLVPSIPRSLPRTSIFSLSCSQSSSFPS
jgi:hypothetical protein